MSNKCHRPCLGTSAGDERDHDDDDDDDSAAGGQQTGTEARKEIQRQSGHQS